MKRDGSVDAQALRRVDLFTHQWAEEIRILKLSSTGESLLHVGEFYDHAVVMRDKWDALARRLRPL